MTITTNPVRNEYTATAGQTVFSYTFKIFTDTDLNVYVTPSGQAANDTTDLVTPSLVTGAGDENGGTVTIAACTAGDLVTIVSDIPESRTTDYQNNGDFRPDVVNDDFDRVVSLVKQAIERSNRGLAFQESEQDSQGLTLPKPEAGRSIRWKGDGSGFENADISTPVELSISNVAALRNLTASADYADGTTADLLGYHNAGDGGGDRIYWDATSTETDNNYSIFQVTGVPIGRWKRTYDVLKPEHFGIISGGSYDTEFLSMIEAANGDAIDFNGTYTITDTFTTDITHSINFISSSGTGIIDGGSHANSGFKLNADLDHVKLHGVTFQNFTNQVIQSTNGRTISEIEIERCTIKDSESAFLFNCNVSSANVTLNTFKNLSSSSNIYGIEIGTNTYADQDNMKKIKITENMFGDLVSTGVDAEVHAVLVYGREVIITNNLIENVANDSTSTNGAEAIYTKARYRTVANNVIINGGNSTNGFIAVKGSQRDVVIAPQGFSGTVTNNVLYSTDSNNKAGIYVQCDSTLVQENYVEGLFSTGGIGLSRDTLTNVSIKNNQLDRIDGPYAIFGECDGENITVSDNIINDILGTDAVVSAISLSNIEAAIENLTIKNNEINCINVNASSSINGIIVQSTGGTLDDLKIKDNIVRISSAVTKFGIRLVGTNAISNLVVQGNTASQDMTYPFFTAGTITGPVAIKNNSFYPIQTNGLSNAEIYHSGTIVTNETASGIRTVNLPAAIVGLEYTFARNNSVALRIDPDGTETIRGGGAGKYLELNTNGDTAKLECFKAGEWEITAGNHSYSYEP